MRNERKIFNFESTILRDLTIEKELFDPNIVGYQKKHIWATCRFCGEPSRILGANFKKAGSACHKECRLKEQSKAGSPFLNPEVKAKADKTKLERFGSIYASQNPEIAKKISEVRTSQESLDRWKNTCLERYGVDNAAKTEESKAHQRETFISKYGFDHPMKDPKRVERALEVFQDTVEINEDERYNLINILRTDQFWQDLALPSTTLSSISKKYDLRYNSLTATLVKDEFKDKYYKTYSFPKYQAQMDVANALQYSGTIEQNTRKIIGPLELDIYFPEKNFAIEFNGSHWHSEAMNERKAARHKHIKKTRLCEAKGIRLFHIFEHHWINRKKQITNLLKASLGMNTVRIGARECTISNDDASVFIEDNHIQGAKTNILRYFNLVHSGKVVASMTASAHHRLTNSPGTIVLSRLCFADGVTIQGGASKLFTAFVSWAKVAGFANIISWSDNCWTQGNIYKVLGFTLSNETGPDYFYWDMHNKRYRSKQSQKKSSSNCPEGMTEQEWACARGLYRIWDCGKKRWDYQLKIGH